MYGPIEKCTGYVLSDGARKVKHIKGGCGDPYGPLDSREIKQ